MSAAYDRPKAIDSMLQIEPAKIFRSQTPKTLLVSRRSPTTSWTAILSSPLPFPVPFGTHATMVTACVANNLKVYLSIGGD